MWRTHSQRPFIRADKISLTTTTTSPFHYTCDSECSCSTASQWGKCNIDDLTSEVLDPFCSPTDQVHSSPVCSVQEDWWSAIYHSKAPYPTLVKSGVSLSDPFTITGLDLTGALYVHTTEGESKVYLCLFTCAVSRAIHSEIVTDLTVECFLQAFCRFARRRSLPKMLLSGNGSTFLAAAAELTHLLSSDELSERLAHKGVDWKFIPKRAPWFGGFWE